MLHKNLLPFSSTVSSSATSESIQIESPASRLILVPSRGGDTPKKNQPVTQSALIDLITISAHRCSAFFAEAAVLVLVLALLDRFMLKGRMEIGWVVGAFSISILLLAASIVTDFFARRWPHRN